MNLEDRIREAIDRRTETAGESDRVPEGLIRRARRRIAATVAVSVFAVVAVAGGGFAVVRSLQPDPKPVPGATPSVFPSPEPVQSPETTAVVVDFVRAFMDARVAGSGAESYLSSDAQGDYEDRRDGFVGTGAVLYGDEERPIAEFLIADPRQIEGSLYEVYVATLRQEIGDTPPCPFTETLLVDPNAAGDEPRIVSSVENPAGTIGNPINEFGAQAFACVFMNARVAHEDASRFLSAQAQGQYQSGEGGLELNPGFPGSWWVAEAHLSDAEGAIVIVAYQGDDPANPEYELFTIAPGTNANGDPSQAVIASARVVDCTYDGAELSCV